MKSNYMVNFVEICCVVIVAIESQK